MRLLDLWMQDVRVLDERVPLRLIVYVVEDLSGVMVLQVGPNILVIEDQVDLLERQRKIVPDSSFLII